MSGPAGIFVKVVLIVLAFYILYVIYKFLNTTEVEKDYIAINGVTLARGSGVNTNPGVSFNKNDEKPKVFDIVNGSDFSIQYWLYISDTSYNLNKNKFILSIGGSMGGAGDPLLNPANNSISDQSLIVYLTAYNYGLAIRTNARKTGDPNPLSNATLTPLFRDTAAVASVTPSLTPCDIPSVDIQKWVHVGIVSSGKTLDVYLDGKLARSCILPSMITVGTNYNLNIFGFGGFGGYVSNVTTHDYALNPEQMWRIYMAGPGPSYTLWQYIKSLFNPRAVGTLEYPKYPQPSE